MKAYRDGKLVIEGPLMACATGFVCDKVEIDAKDARDLDMFYRDARYAWFAQFAARFVDNRK